MSWLAESHRVIGEALKDLPKDAPLDEVRKILRDAYPFGERKCWPYRQWLRAVRWTIQQRKNRLPVPPDEANEVPDWFTGGSNS